METVKNQFEEKFPSINKTDYRCFADDINGDISGCVNDRNSSCYGEICFYKDRMNIYKKEDCIHWRPSNIHLTYSPNEVWQFIEQKCVPKSEMEKLNIQLENALATVEYRTKLFHADAKENELLKEENAELKEQISELRKEIDEHSCKDGRTKAIDECIAEFAPLKNKKVPLLTISEIITILQQLKEVKG